MLTLSSNSRGDSGQGSRAALPYAATLCTRPLVAQLSSLVPPSDSLRRSFEFPKRGKPFYRMHYSALTHYPTGALPADTHVVHIILEFAPVHL